MAQAPTPSDVQSSKPKKPLSAVGYLADSLWYDEHTPVVCNPETTPEALLTWCWAEVSSLKAVADAFSAGAKEMDREQIQELLNVGFVYRLEPLERVLYYAVGQVCDRCMRAEKALPHGWSAEEEAAFRASTARIVEREQDAKATGRATP